MSEAALTGWPCACSGERYCAVPMIEPVCVMSEAPARAMPKSVTVTRPSSERITLCGLMSRCTIPRLWAKLAASSTWIVMSMAASGSSGPCSRTTRFSERPCRYSIAM